ncbi:Protein NPAT [Triplophysa tibetana]|uniref:Protein NPAT n=1 Tax=Triplophysa tibetana TaxID=1572043 RepID=A0A5A9MYV6_9TELE|nr:Protein NPAT [Triplophysa tibetana]
MLLPSDIARLVLGYLQQEGLSASSRAFIFESPNLKEYAEHSSEDGIIPACVFSLFGKNLITILNEYVAVKANDTSQENQIPVVMTSLWKKLDFTLGQIKSMQNSPALQMNQRLRTKHHIQSMARQQRPISASQSPNTGHLPVTCSVTSQCVPSPLSTPQGMLGHSTPVSYTSQYTRPSTLCLTQLAESPLQILVPDHRLNPGPLSPARRKCDSPRRRGGGQLGASGTSRSTVVSSNLGVETSSEENVAENLSQIVIENARETILNDRSLQEKLAENINKILASDNSPQTSKAACSTMEQEQSIDEILGLQGEIHMTDVAIHDILAQTESDPAFQALFDLFDYGKNNGAEASEQADGSISTIAQESDETMHIDSASETGTTQEDSEPGGESNARNLRSQNTSESKSKKNSPVICNAKEPDPSKIVSLKIILSDEQDGQTSDVALNQAVSSITGDRIPTIFLSSPAKSPAKSVPTASAVITLEETAQAVNTLQGMEAVGSFGTPTRSVLSNVQAIITRPVGQETGFIQLLPANPSYGPQGSYFVVTDPTTAEQRSNVVLLPNTVSQGTVSSSPHVLATPPRQRTVVSMGPNISQIGSTIIISSPVQPMLQNVMVPVSVVGQNTGKLPNQMLSLPCSNSVRQPVKLISQPKVLPKENTDIGKPGLSGPVQVTKLLPKTSQSSDQPKIASGTSPSHRRILRFETTPENTTAAQSSTQTTTLTSIVSSPPTHQDKDNKRTEPDQTVVSDTSKKRIKSVRLPGVNRNTGKKDCEKSSAPLQQSEAQESKVTEKRSIDETAVSARTFNKTASEPQVRLESQKKTQASNKDGGTVLSAKSSAHQPKLKQASNTNSSTPEEPHVERSSDKISIQDSPGVASNKENELEGCQQEQCPTAARPPENLASSTAKPATPISSASVKMLCKTSPLTKQAVEMLHDIQGQTPLKKQGASCPEIPFPRTPAPVRTQEEVTDGLRTPCRQKHGREGESTPRCLPPPATPDLPSCSPASEAGSENSINMAAHTLMILSRAARTGGPLKDSLRQEEASAGKSSAPKTKKRKHVEPSPPAKKELQLSGSSGSKKKSKKPKKVLDSFPDDLDVDKFLSSLHYDE